MTVAVTALSGCVTVRHSPVPHPPAVPAQSAVPRPDGRAGTPLVQAPAQEALEKVGTDPGREPDASASPRRAASAAPAGQPPSARHRPPAPARPGPARPEGRRPALPRVEVPGGKEGARGNADVCGLGRKYGGWGLDSPESVICEGAYGR